MDWKALDLKRRVIPDDMKLKDCVEVKYGFKTIQNVQVFYQEALPPADSKKTNVSVLLLHGKMFSSKTWMDLGTIHLLAAMGFRTIAIDLPGFANSPLAEINDKVEFLHLCFQAFGQVLPVVVSPSLSGLYALPYLVQKSEFMAGYVPVAPVGFQVLEEFPSCEDKSIVNGIYKPLQEFLHDPVPDLNNIKTPTMIVFGERDRSRSSALLSLLPNSQCQEIPNGSHPAYLDDPNLWHQLMYNFLCEVANSHDEEKTF